MKGLVAYMHLAEECDEVRIVRCVTLTFHFGWLKSVVRMSGSVLISEGRVVWEGSSLLSAALLSIVEA